MVLPASIRQRLDDFPRAIRLKTPLQLERYLLIIPEILKEKLAPRIRVPTRHVRPYVFFWVRRRSIGPTAKPLKYRVGAFGMSYVQTGTTNRSKHWVVGSFWDAGSVVSHRIRLTRTVPWSSDRFPSVSSAAFGSNARTIASTSFN